MVVLLQFQQNSGPTETKAQSQWAQPGGDSEKSGHTGDTPLSGTPAPGLRQQGASSVALTQLALPHPSLITLNVISLGLPW